MSNRANNLSAHRIAGIDAENESGLYAGFNSASNWGHPDQSIDSWLIFDIERIHQIGEYFNFFSSIKIVFK